MPKGSFYYFFESKMVLALAVIDEHRVGPAAGMDRHPEQRRRTTAPAAAAVRGDGGRPARRPAERWHRLGLPAGESHPGDEGPDRGIRTRLQEIFDAQVDMVDAVITEVLEREEVTATGTREAGRFS
ncbi:hypothetical protein ACWEQP_21155 [Streptomyces sp. NPDC004044]